ncbi:hypothetical protein [Pseudomonas laurylsulfatiphila]|uniref:Uncharacterized protein n=1 Tax=Pseudomonas laurylsulfatiphila TaxID=2011015 RepID=A0A2S6FMQ9_9PSED|nr:hypothetical protein [Pseudomonas laurylsulfatiphila]PPK38696.1 hypothetical protein CD175_12925 [Pseudomonas laurylsulfatiphila]
MVNRPDDLIDISKPIVRSPKSGGHYYSPLTVEIIRGEGGHYAANWFRIDFYWHGPQGLKGAPLSPYSLAMSPGPHKLDTRAEWSEDSREAESDWVFIDEFYVLTPPLTR